MVTVAMTFHSGLAMRATTAYEALMGVLGSCSLVDKDPDFVIICFVVAVGHLSFCFS